MIPLVGPPRFQFANHLAILHEGRGFWGNLDVYTPTKIWKVQVSIEVRGFALWAPRTGWEGLGNQRLPNVVTDKCYCGSVGELASSKQKSKYSWAHILALSLAGTRQSMERFVGVKTFLGLSCLRVGAPTPKAHLRDYGGQMPLTPVRWHLPPGLPPVVQQKPHH